jgi:hypothetical protein
MIDFTELSQDGRDLEQLVRELAFVLNLNSHWTGVGPDGGKDLLLEEVGDPIFGRKVRRWLVSVKHFAHANNGRGRAVGLEDIGDAGGIMNAVDQHGANGFLLVCSTYPSSGLMTRLSDIEQKKQLPIHVWDGVVLQRLLASPQGWAVAQRFSPVSTDAGGWKIFATDEPNRSVGISRGMYIRLSNRIGSGLSFDLRWIDARLDRAAAIALPKGHELRLRGAWYDDKNGDLSTHWDYLWEGEEVPGEGQLSHLSEKSIEETLGSGTNIYDDTQFDSITVKHHRVKRGNDHYDVDHYQFYRQLPDYW